MRRKMIFKIGITLVIFVAVFLYYAIHLEEPDGHQMHHNRDGDDGKINPPEQPPHVEVTDKKGNGENKKSPASDVPVGEAIHLSVVACGVDRVEETMVMLKSAILLSTKHLVFHIFAEDELHQSFREKLDFWPDEFQKKFHYNIYSITFPPGQNRAEWKKLFKPCASQRLFIPVILTDVDAMLYVDTDILFLRPIDDVWDHFKRMNSSQFAALAPEHEDAATSWYKRFSRHPYYGPLGVNSGVMLMNLTRMREFDWLKHVLQYYQDYKLKITWGDQDLINIIFHFYPERLYVYSCDWNFRPDHCMYMSVCKTAEQRGISVLHGNRGVLHNDKQPTFRAIYRAFSEHHLGEPLQYGLLVKMKRYLEQTKTTNCGRVAAIFTKQFEEQVIEWQRVEDQKWNLQRDSVVQV